MKNEKIIGLVFGLSLVFSVAAKAADASETKASVPSLMARASNAVSTTKSGVIASKNFLGTYYKNLLVSALSVGVIRSGDKVSEFALKASSTATIAGSQLDRVDHSVVEKIGNKLLSGGGKLRTGGLFLGRAIRNLGMAVLVYETGKVAYRYGYSSGSTDALVKRIPAAESAVLYSLPISKVAASTE